MKMWTTLLVTMQMDDICLSPELDGTLGVPTFEHSYGHHSFWEERFRENRTTVNASWEQNASA
jgi:DNA-directed RNA polymerase-5 subunit 1